MKQIYSLTLKATIMKFYLSTLVFLLTTVLSSYGQIESSTHKMYEATFTPHKRVIKSNSDHLKYNAPTDRVLKISAAAKELLALNPLPSNSSNSVSENNGNTQSRKASPFRKRKQRRVHSSNFTANKKNTQERQKNATSSVLGTVETALDPFETIMSPYRLDKIMVGTDTTEERIYNDNGELSSEVYYDAATGYTGSAYLYSYYTDFPEILGQTDFYTWTNGAWEPYGLQQYDYDANFNVTAEYYYSYDAVSETFSIVSKDAYVYTDGKITMAYTYYWSTTEEMFKISNRREFRYDVNNNLTDEWFNDWNDTNETYDALYYEGYVYNTENLLIQNFSGDNYDAVNDIYPYYARTDIYYETNGIIDEVIEFDMDAPTSTWVPGYGIAYLVDVNNGSELVLDTQDYVWNTNFDNWEEDGDASKVFYSLPTVLSTLDILELSVSLYPNPATNAIKIESGSNTLSNAVFELFDINGRFLFSKRLNNSNSISIKDLAPAMYVYKIKEGASVLKSGKLLKQ